MEYLSLIYTPVYAITIQIPAYIACSPVFILSSTLYKRLLGFKIDDEALIMMFTLIAIWTISAFIIFQLILVRSYKSILFYKFVFYVSLFNSILIGVTYSLMKRV